VKSDILAKTGLATGLISNPTALLAMVEELFDHVPETVFLNKDQRGLYLAVNQTLVERCGLREKHELIGRRHVRAVFPKELAERYAGRAIPQPPQPPHASVREYN